VLRADEVPLPEGADDLHREEEEETR
jgi:hypothetical protein